MQQKAFQVEKRHNIERVWHTALHPTTVTVILVGGRGGARFHPPPSLPQCAPFLRTRETQGYRGIMCRAVARHTRSGACVSTRNFILFFFWHRFFWGREGGSEARIWFFEQDCSFDWISIGAAEFQESVLNSTPFDRNWVFCNDPSRLFFANRMLFEKQKPPLSKNSSKNFKLQLYCSLYHA